MRAAASAAVAPLYADPSCAARAACPCAATSSRASSSNGEVIVHRVGCPGALNPVSVTELLTPGSRAAAAAAAAADGGMAAKPRRAVAITWTPWVEPHEFACELEVFCSDRKFLLADVSIVVSREATIENTWSRSNTEGTEATLQYSVKVKDLQHLQTLINAIREVDGVMAVGRLRRGMRCCAY